MLGYLLGALSGRSGAVRALHRHFDRRPVDQVVTASRQFPVTARVDLQEGVARFVGAHGAAQLVSIHAAMGHETPTLASLFTPSPFPLQIAPLQHDEIDVGEPAPVRCLRNGLWLGRAGDLPFAILMAQAMQYGHASGVHLEMAVPSGEAGAVFSQEFFAAVEAHVGAGRTYRGRVISLEAFHDPSGRGGAIKVHRLAPVARDEIILPQATLDLLDRNIGGFVAARERIKALRFSARKGLLFHGAPGTGKTHTIHYLASHLPGHTTLLVTAEQAMFIGQYFLLARYLQPSIVVIEDVDLIARERAHLQSPFQETLLNKLLNEMDGLREDADVIVILTTNRPDQLEPALAARPGRIDQAIEFPLPDPPGRRKLLYLYARGLVVDEPIADLIVGRTHGASAAFIKELMRRAAQFQIEAGGGERLSERALDAALEEMVFSGGALNLKLLGGALSPNPAGARSDVLG